MGLGDRGKNQVKKGSPSGLFTRTEPDVTEIHTSSNQKTQNTINTEIQESLPEKNDQRKNVQHISVIVGTPPKVCFR